MPERERVIRTAGVPDLAALVRLERECLGVDAWSETLVAAGVAGQVPTVTWLVSEAAGSVVGYAVTSAAGDIAELQRIAVEAGARRHGHASALLAAVVETAQRTEADRLLVEVREDNRGALAFYAAHDFVEIGRRPGYYADGTTAVVLRRPLGPGCGSGTMAP